MLSSWIRVVFLLLFVVVVVAVVVLMRREVVRKKTSHPRQQIQSQSKTTIKSSSSSSSSSSTVAAIVFNCNQRLRADPDGFATLFSGADKPVATPSILLLQEVEHTEDVRVLEDRGWTLAAWEPRSEIAIFVDDNVWKVSSAFIERMPDDDFYRNAAVIADLESRVNRKDKISVMSVHLSSTEYKRDEEVRVQEMQWLLKRIKQHQVDLVGGDFNSVSHLDHHLPVHNIRFASQVLQDAGFADIGSRPGPLPKTFVKSGFNWNRGTWLETLDRQEIDRIDRAYLSDKRWSAKRSDVWIITPDQMPQLQQWPTGEDHACLYITLSKK